MVRCLCSVGAVEPQSISLLGLASHSFSQDRPLCVPVDTGFGRNDLSAEISLALRANCRFGVNRRILIQDFP